VAACFWAVAGAGAGWERAFGGVPARSLTLSTLYSVRWTELPTPNPQPPTPPNQSYAPPQPPTPNPQPPHPKVHYIVDKASFGGVFWKGSVG